MKMISIVGRSGSGKTTLLERVIPILRARGLRVACVKHSHHVSLDVDRRGKDSFRLREAGADAVALLSPGSLIVFERPAEELDADALARRLPAVDVVLVESWKAQRLPCIEVIGPGGDRVPADLLGPVLAVAAAGERSGDWLARDDAAGVADRIHAALGTPEGPAVAP